MNYKLMAAVPYNIAMETERSSLFLNTEELLSLALITFCLLKVICPGTKRQPWLNDITRDYQARMTKGGKSKFLGVSSTL